MRLRYTLAKTNLFAPFLLSQDKHTPHMAVSVRTQILPGYDGALPGQLNVSICNKLKITFLSNYSGECVYYLPCSLS